MRTPVRPESDRRRRLSFPLIIASLMVCSPLAAQNSILENPGCKPVVPAARSLDTRAQLGLDEIFRSTFDEQWIDVTGPGFWQCNANCSVVNGQFVEAGAGMTINPTGTWTLGFRPTAVRVDATISPMQDLGVGCGAGGNDFGSCSNYAANTTCLLNVFGNIERMNLYNSGTIRKIEFLVP